MSTHTTLESDTEYILVLLCYTTHDEGIVRRQAARLSEMQVSTIVVGADPSGTLARECESYWHASVLSLPTSVASIKKALNKALFEPSAKRHRIAMHDYANRLSLLSSRQRLILQMAAEGVTNRRIARVVGLSEKSVERERRMSRQLINVSNPAEMMRVVTLGAIFQYGDIEWPNGQRNSA